MLHNDLYAWLINTPEIVALFPGGIHHESLPQDIKTWPAMSFFLVSHTEIADDMEAPNDDKLDNHQYQFDVISETSGPCIDAANSFLKIFRNFRGTMTTTRVQWVTLANISHLEERRGDKLRRRVSMDFSLFVDVTE